MDSVYVPKTFLNWEVRADREYLFAQEGNRWFKASMSKLDHCVVSYSVDYTFQVTAKNKEHREFSVTKKGDHALQLFRFLQSFSFGFDKVVSTYTPHTWKHSIHCYRIDQNSFTGDVEKFFSKTMKPEFCIPIRDIMALTQHHRYDTEGADAFWLRIYTSDGKFRDIEGDSIQHCYEIALMIKDNAPHVRYGIYSRNGALY